MTYLEQIQRGVDFIEENLDRHIALAEVARAAGMSQWHFQRIFKALTNETLKTYIRSRRLAHSLEALIATKERILDIALAAGFQSQESFGRAFKKQFGLTPNAYRQIGERSLFLRKVQFDLQYLEHINTNISVAPRMEELGTMRCVGLETAFYSVDSEKNSIAETLPALWDAFLPRLTELEKKVEGMGYGIIRQHDDGGGLLRYCAAVEVLEDQKIPEGMSEVRLAPATYAIFQHRGPAETLDRTVNYIYSTWLASSDYRHTYAPDLELYGEDFRQGDPQSIIEYAIPVSR